MSAGLVVPRPRVQRISSQDAGRGDLAVGPTVVAPPSHLMARSKSYEVAKGFELARYELDALRSQQSTPDSTADAVVTDKFAYAFDIDGVLIRGGKVIPEALEAMKILNGDNEYGISIPYIFVTNGGGKSEQERCIQLSEQLEIEVSPGQFICGHTPMREMAERYKAVLVVGGEGEKCRHVAEGYGFQQVITPGDIIKHNADTTPFRKLTDAEFNDSRKHDFDVIEIEAIFVFADSRDWASDQQIILDVLMSQNGRLGTRSETFEDGPPVFFSHNDVVWSAAHDLTRIGMGALRVSLEAMFKAVTGKELETTAFGKPQLGTFEFANRLLQQWRKDTHGINGPPETVYFVGDTPESDIRGTNEFDERADNSWYSILVGTGVYAAGTTPTFEPKATVDNVLEAVMHGIEREHRKALNDKARTAAVVEQ